MLLTTTSTRLSSKTSATSNVDDRFKTCEFGFYNVEKIKFEDEIIFVG